MENVLMGNITPGAAEFGPAPTPVTTLTDAVRSPAQPIDAEPYSGGGLKPDIADTVTDAPAPTEPGTNKTLLYIGAAALLFFLFRKK
jgi:hypothetical protein